MKQDILKHLPGDFSWNIQWFERVPSTNDLLKDLGKAGAPHGTVIIADSQSKGRGRMGRCFHSPAASGIYLSLLLRPGCQAKELMHLTCAVAVTMCDAIEKVCGFRPGTKWVNDLVIRNRKLGGILTEMAVDGDGRVVFCVIGVGINCKETAFPRELQDIAISLEAVTGKPVDRAALIAETVTALKEMSDGLPGNAEQYLRRYRQDCITLGKHVAVLRGEEKLPAFAREIDEEGALVVQYPDGRIETVAAGEVSIRGICGYL